MGGECWGNIRRMPQSFLQMPAAHCLLALLQMAVCLAADAVQLTYLCSLQHPAQRLVGSYCLVALWATYLYLLTFVFELLPEFSFRDRRHCIENEVREALLQAPPSLPSLPQSEHHHAAVPSKFVLFGFDLGSPCIVCPV